MSAAGTIAVTVRGDFSQLRRQLSAAVQGMAELAEQSRRSAAQALRFQLAFLDAVAQLATGRPDPRGDLHIQVVTTQRGTRLVAQRLGGWQRMHPAPDERNP